MFTARLSETGRKGDAGTGRTGRLNLPFPLSPFPPFSSHWLTEALAYLFCTETPDSVQTESKDDAILLAETNVE